MAIHANGMSNNAKLWPLICETVFSSEIKSSIPSNLSIITWEGIPPKGFPGKPFGCLKRSIEHLGGEVTVLEEDRAWTTNRLKFELTLDFLNTSKSEYVLGADSGDVLILPGISEAIQRFEAFNCQMLFSAERAFWPKDASSEWKLNEESIGNAPYNYLNAGLWMGRREFCIEAVETAMKFAKDLETWKWSEQVCWHPTYLSLYPKLKIDCGCNLFQNLVMVETSEIEIIK